jgi:hypothetical protein
MLYFIDAGNQPVLWHRDSHFHPDHPPPHFHAVYADQQAVVTIDSIGLHEGNLSPRALALVFEWAAQHQMELMANWNALRAGQLPKKIKPLR